MRKKVSANQQSTTNEEFAKVLIFIRHVRNNFEMQPNYVRVEAAAAAEQALERALGKNMEQVYKTKVWKQG